MIQNLGFTSMLVADPIDRAEERPVAADSTRVHAEAAFKRRPV